MKHSFLTLAVVLVLASVGLSQLFKSGRSDHNRAEQKNSTTDSTERNKALVTRWAEAVWKKDLSAAQALVTDDCVIHAVGSTYSEGPEALKQWLASADPNWSYGGSTTDDIIADGDKVVRRTTVFARYKLNDRSTITPVVFTYRLANGKIAEVWQVANYVQTYTQAGAQLVMPGVPEASATKTKDEEELLKTKQEFSDAVLRNDADRVAPFYGDDYAIINHDGTLNDKATHLEHVRSGRLRYSALASDDVVIRMYRDGAVVIERRKQAGSFDGKSRPQKVRATEVWVKRLGNWRLVCTQITPIQEAWPTPGPFLASPPQKPTAVTAHTPKPPVVEDTAGETPKASSEAEREILKALQEQDNAIRNHDPDADARTLGDDYLFVIWAGTLSNKEYQVEAQRTGFLRNTSLTTDVPSVRIYGDLAVVIRHKDQRGTIGGLSGAQVGVTGNSRSTRAGVWVKRDGRWQNVSGQNTPILETDKTTQSGTPRQ